MLDALEYPNNFPAKIAAVRCSDILPKFKFKFCEQHLKSAYVFSYCVGWSKQVWKVISNDIHCVKSVVIRSYSGPYSVRMRENTDQNNSE